MAADWQEEPIGMAGSSDPDQSHGPDDDKLLHQTRLLLQPPQPSQCPQPPQLYKVYKRRWFGLAQLTLLNIVVSCNWLTFSPVASSAAQFFKTTEANINWLSTAFLFAFVAIAPLVIYLLHWGPRPSIITAAVLVLVGNWVRYGGVMATAHNFAVVMFGHILIGFAQPFVLAAPTRYSDLWFTDRGRVAATALMTLANPFGAAVSQLIVPLWVSSSRDIPNAVLYMSIIATTCALPSFFVPAKPPTAAAASGETEKLALRLSGPVLARAPEFWMILVPFAIYVGFFNSTSSLLTQMMAPYGFSDSESGIGGALLILVGLVTAAVTSPILDRTKCFLPALKAAVPLIGLCYLIFVWMPATRAVPGPYVVLAILGASNFSLVPLAIELLVELTHPVGPEVTSTLAWSAGQLLGAVFILVSNGLKDGPAASPPANMHRALVFQAVLAMAVVPFPLSLGLFGRREKVVLRRVHLDRLDNAYEQRAVAVQAGRQEGEENTA